jgi:preprotein translocase subunit SecA
MDTWEDKAKAWIKGLFGETNDKKLKFLTDFQVRANEFEPQLEKLSDEELQAKTAEFRNRIDNAMKGVPDKLLMPLDAPKMPGQFRTEKDRVLAGVLEEMLSETFAVCREASRRVLGMRHFDVQLVGGAALHFNKIAEMRTGEGKTLVATLPAYLNGLTGRGVHVVTVNDYLARRDSEWMGRLYKWLGLSVGLIYSHQPEQEKFDAYRADIAYGTNHEFGFDYLRDNMRTSLDALSQRPYYFAIVDEVDNILIDEARTPLIISGFPQESFIEVYKTMCQVAPMMQKGTSKDDENCDYWVDEKTRNVLLTERGIGNAEKMLGVSDLYDVRWNLAHHLSQALRAKELYKVDTDYVIRPNEEGKPEIVIVDEFTGRMMVGRRWSDGLHQAIEAKEGVPIQDETMTYASITYQNLFRLYPKLAGMTGTAMTEAAEFQKIYNLDVIAVPTNKTSIRRDEADVIYKTERQKYYSVVEEIAMMHEIGRPVLVGTVSIEKSELVADLLSKPQGMGEFLQRKISKAVDYVRNKKLAGPSIDGLMKIFERPGLIDPVKLEPVCKQIENEFPKADELIERCYSILKTARVVAAIRKGIAHHVLNAKHHEKEALIVAQAGRKGGVTIATNMAGRGTDIVLGGNPEFLAKEQLAKEKLAEATDQYEARLKEIIPKYKVETDQEHDEVVNLGGLHIIGTERHEARRIDNQLRGRAGRQGDPGSTRFFLSLEDTLMRIFGGERIAKLMDLINADEEMPIEHGMVTKSIENAQKKVEAYHFDMRKHVLQYDDVLNTQREVIYRERRRILEKSNLREEVVNMLEDHIDIILRLHIDAEQTPEMWEEKELPEMMQVLANDVPMFASIPIDELAGLSFIDLREKIMEAGQIAYQVREEHIGADVMRELERQILLRTIDSKWIDYLHNIEQLREGIHLRGYGQRDPLQEYKREAYEMFEQLLRSIQTESIQLVFRAQPMSMSDMMMDELGDEDVHEDFEAEARLMDDVIADLRLEAERKAASGQDSDDTDEEEKNSDASSVSQQPGTEVKDDAKGKGTGDYEFYNQQSTHGVNPAPALDSLAPDVKAAGTAGSASGGEDRSSSSKGPNE